MSKIERVGLGGGCHWCTEGVFQSLVGIAKVEQGWIASTGDQSTESEAIIVHFDPAVIDLKSLVEIHLHTHASTANHSMRAKYRSAVYTFGPNQEQEVKDIIKELQKDFDKPLVTQVLPFDTFRLNQADQLNYFYNRPDSSFCTTYIHPKLSLLMREFGSRLNPDKMDYLTSKSINLHS